MKLSSLSLSADALVSTFNKVIASDNAKMPLSGGELSGDLRILSGNYFQTSDPGSVFDFCSHGGHVEAD